MALVKIFYGQQRQLVHEKITLTIFTVGFFLRIFVLLGKSNDQNLLVIRDQKKIKNGFVFSFVSPCQEYLCLAAWQVCLSRQRVTAELRAPNCELRFVFVGSGTRANSAAAPTKITADCER